MLSAAASALFAGQIDSASSSSMRSWVYQIILQPGQNARRCCRGAVAGRLRSTGVSSSNSAAADFVAVGKRINDDLHPSFEQALSGAEYFVVLQYRLTRQLSVIARAGSNDALDLVNSLPSTDTAWLKPAEQCVTCNRAHGMSRCRRSSR